MDTLENLGILEDKLHFLTYRYSQISEENHQLKEQLDEERQKNQELKTENESLRKETKNFELTKKNIRKKIENLIEQLTGNNGETDMHSETENKVRQPSNQISLEEAAALNKPFTDEILANTTINFLSEEEI